MVSKSQIMTRPRPPWASEQDSRNSSLGVIWTESTYARAQGGGGGGGGGGGVASMASELVSMNRGSVARISAIIKHGVGQDIVIDVPKKRKTIHRHTLLDLELSGTML